MGDHIVRRGAAGSSPRRSEPRPTAELSKQELNNLIREPEPEPELEIGGDTPRVPNASSPRMFAHTLRRTSSPDAPAQTARGSTPREAVVPRGDVSTIEMPRVERSAVSEFDQFGDVISDDELTRQLRHRIAARDEFDDSIPPAENDFEADCAVIEPSFVPPGYLPLPAMAEEMPQLDEPLVYARSEERRVGKECGC